MQRLEGGIMARKKSATGKRKYAAFGKLLKYYRELRSLGVVPPWSQARLAKELGVSPRTYAMWEGGESQPSPDDLKNFVAVLKLTEDEEKNLYRVRTNYRRRKNTSRSCGTASSRAVKRTWNNYANFSKRKALCVSVA